MTRSALWMLVLMVIGLAIYYFVPEEIERVSRRVELPAPGQPISKEISKVDAVVLERSTEGTVVWPRSVEILEPLSDPKREGHADVDAAEQVLKEYRTVFGENPVGGLNVEVTEKLAGRNAKGIQFLPPGLSVINEVGEWVDVWGTPLFFHAVSRDVMEVRSAGADRKLWTADDVGN